MDLSAINPALLIASLLVAATPILLAGIGELVVERAGVLNLGVEGMMITGAICGFMATIITGSPALGFIFAAIGGAALSFLFALLTQYALANQVASGLALTLFGLGLSSLLGQDYVGLKPPSTPKLDIPILSDLPFLGTVLFSHDVIVYLGIALVACRLGHTQIHPRRPCAARCGRKPRCRTCAWLQSRAHSRAGNHVRRSLCRPWRCLHQPHSCSTMDRRYDSGRRLDRPRVSRICQLEAMARFARCLAFRRRDRFTA